MPARKRDRYPPPGGSRSPHLGGSRGLRQQPAPVRLDDGRDAAVDAELPHRVAQVLLDRVAAEEEPRPDLAVRATLGGEPEDAELLARELRLRRPRPERRRSRPRID